jgi:peptidoglycan/LPS O-acetylase OafA/YrhL
MKSSSRLIELDALRGIAATVVVFSHLLFVFGPRTITHSAERIIPKAYMVFELSPLHLLVAGHEAVILFFLLSGFVLALPYTATGRIPVKAFLVKRVCRLYIPYAAAVVLACAFNAYLYGPVAGTSDWFAHTWAAAPNFRSILQHFVMLGEYDYTRYNTAFWSLVHEARISLVFPVLFWFVIRTKPSTAILAAFVTSFAAQALMVVWPHERVVSSLHYIAFFILGALAAKHLTSISQWFRGLSLKQHRALLIGSVVSLSVFQIIKHVPGRIHQMLFITDWPDAIACAALLLSAMTFEPFKLFLQRPAVAYLGKISYSIYLVHATVLFTCIHLLFGRVPFLLVATIYLMATCVVSVLFHYAVEQPASRLGKRVAGSSKRRTQVEVPSTETVSVASSV